MTLQTEIESRSAQEVMNDNDLFSEWVNENLTLDDVIRRCPDVLTMIFEEFNNDWIEVVQNEAAELGITIDDSGNIINDDNNDPAEDAYEAGYQDGENGDPSDSDSFSPFERDYQLGYAEAKKDN